MANHGDVFLYFLGMLQWMVVVDNFSSGVLKSLQTSNIGRLFYND